MAINAPCILLDGRQGSQGQLYCSDRNASLFVLMTQRGGKIMAPAAAATLM